MFHEYPNSLQKLDIITGKMFPFLKHSIIELFVPTNLYMCCIPSSIVMFIYFENNGILKKMDTKNIIK